MSYSLRKRRRISKISKRKYNKTRRCKKSRKQYCGSNFILKIEGLLNNFNFYTEREKNTLMKKLISTQWRYDQNPRYKNILIDKLNLALNSTDSTPDEKKTFIYKLFDFWVHPERYHQVASNQ
jgi:hypothetical protein